MFAAAVWCTTVAPVENTNMGQSLVIFNAVCVWIELIEMRRRPVMWLLSVL